MRNINKHYIHCCKSKVILFIPWFCATISENILSKWSICSSHRNLAVYSLLSCSAWTWQVLKPFSLTSLILSAQIFGSSESITWFLPEGKLFKAMPSPQLLLIRRGRSAEIALRPLIPKPSVLDGLMRRSTSQSNLCHTSVVPEHLRTVSCFTLIPSSYMACWISAMSSSWSTTRIRWYDESCSRLIALAAMSHPLTLKYLAEPLISIRNFSPVSQHHEHVRMQKNAHFNIVSTTLLIGLNIKFLVRNLRKAACISIPLYSIQLP